MTGTRRTTRSFCPVGRVVLALALSGCAAAPDAEYPAVHGRRVHTATVAAHATQYRVGAYELVFEPLADANARRAALVVDLASGRGLVRGFVEWGRAGDAPLTYVAGGWAEQRQVSGASVTVFELALRYAEAADTRHGAPIRAASTPLAVRVVVDEGSGQATLTRRR